MYAVRVGIASSEPPLLCRNDKRREHQFLARKRSARLGAGHSPSNLGALGEGERRPTYKVVERVFLRYISYATPIHMPGAFREQGILMDTKDIAVIILSALALVVSVFTAYRTFLARFRGKIWFSNRIVLGRLENVPALGLACFFENSGARPGILDDLRARIEQKDSGTITYFFPMLMRSDYNILRAYSESDWYPFGMLSLPPAYRADKYLLLKPQNNQFIAITGDMIVSLELRWHNQQKWEQVLPSLHFTLPHDIVSQWNDPSAPAIQVISNEVMEQRRQ